ncbi:Glycosyltransferase family 92 protein At1g27200 [Linum perenne]
MKAPPRLLPLLLPLPAANSCLILHRLPDTMRALLLFLFLLFSVSIFLSLSPNSSSNHFFYDGLNFTTDAPSTIVAALPNPSFPSNHAVQEPAEQLRAKLTNSRSVDPPAPSSAARGDYQIESTSILFPDWQVLVIVSRDVQLISGEEFVCLYPNKEASPARFSGVLPSTNQSIFKCLLPERCRRLKEMKQPVLVRSSLSSSVVSFPPPESPRWLLRWAYLAYESFSTETDVVLFVKGVNNKQGFNRPAEKLKCVFSNADAVTTTAVTISEQEVFRCRHPDITALGPLNAGTGVKISLEISESDNEKTIVPSVVYYTPPWRRRIANSQPKLQICAGTMVYNAAKFLREWVIYHSGIGVEKFFLYDNDSDDDIQSVVGALNQEGYKVETMPWIWPKSQEAGFSHLAVYAKESCDWMMYIDVDEFVFSPRWSSAAQPSNWMLKSLIPNRRVGQVSIRCNEFGPSGRESHPEEGVTQGYDCRRKLDNRHKSIVLLEAIDYSLLNAVHHFRLKRSGGGEYKWKKVKLETAVVNHYKYQAWSEFRVKFRRRVSAYVIDWKKTVNPASKDRAPGLGFREEKPGDWERRFCEVKDRRLQWLTLKWFGGGYKMAWQR